MTNAVRCRIGGVDPNNRTAGREPGIADGGVS
jgi:hypothetical protein